MEESRMVRAGELKYPDTIPIIVHVYLIEQAAYQVSSSTIFGPQFHLTLTLTSFNTSWIRS